MTAQEELENVLKAWMKQVMHHSMHSFTQLVADSGLTMPQMAVLFRLSGKQPCAITSLGEELGVTGAAASQMVDKLVQAGLIERLEDPEDRRIRRLKLTEEGNKLLAKAANARQEWIKPFCSSFSEDDAKQAVKILERFITATKEIE